MYSRKNSPQVFLEKRKDGELVWKIQMIGIADQEPPYPKIIMWVRQSDYYPVVLDYYDEKDFNSKTLLLSDIQIIESYPTAMTMVMTDNKERSSTTMRTLEITYAWEPPKGFFSERNLKK